LFYGPLFSAVLDGLDSNGDHKSQRQSVEGSYPEEPTGNPKTAHRRILFSCCTLNPAATYLKKVRRNIEMKDQSELVSAPF